MVEDTKQKHGCHLYVVYALSVTTPTPNKEGTNGTTWLIIGSTCHPIERQGQPSLVSDVTSVTTAFQALAIFLVHLMLTLVVFSHRVI